MMNEITNIAKKIVKTLRLKQKVWVVKSDGTFVKESEVSAIKNNYAIIDGGKYWIRAVEGKHRNRNNYIEFAMIPIDAQRYIGGIPKEIMEKELNMIMR